jgi:RNA polymerase sigma factor (sigma-70 family)
VLAADREAFAAVYDRYGPRLYDFAHSMLRHREDAADAVADSFVILAERLGQLRDPARLRPWLYAVVRSECLRRLKARKRVAYADDEQLVEMADDATTPEESAERSALQQLVWDASAGLADRDRALLDLHLRQGLEGAELGEAMGVSASNAYVMLNRLRAQVDRSLGALLIARMGRDDCDELADLLADWDGGFSPLIRKRVARHVDGCDVCSERRRTMVSPWMLLAGVPMFAAPLGLRDRVLEDTRLVAYELPAEIGPTSSTGGHRWGGGRITLGAVAVLVLVLAGLTFWPDADEVSAPAVATPSTGTTPTVRTPVSPTPAVSGSPSTSAAPSPATTPAPLPGTLVASTQSINLGTADDRAALALTNTGELPVDYQVSPRTRWLEVASIGGRLAGGSSTRVTIVADRTKVPEGSSTGRLVVTWVGGSVAIRVRVTEERDPTVGAPSVPAGASCDVVVTVRATDESGVASVRLAWSGPGGVGTARMSRSGTSWAATVHISIGGRYTFAATATDTRGNSASGSSTTVELNPCPQ